MLYPMIDRSIDDMERASVFRTMESLPEERYAVCCKAGHH